MSTIPAKDKPDPAKDTLGDLMERYRREIALQGHSPTVQAFRVTKMRQHPIAALPIAEVTSKAIADYRDDRLASVSDGTVRTELTLIRRTIEAAKQDWGYKLRVNVAIGVTLPLAGHAKARRLLPGEYEKLETEMARSPLIWSFVQFTVETAMRRAELLALTWRDVHLSQGIADIQASGPAEARTVALTDAAIAILSGFKVKEGRVFPIEAGVLSWVWEQACLRANIKGLRIHDCRQEGCLRLFEMGLSVPEVVAITGHKRPATLFPETPVDALAIRRKLAGRKHLNSATPQSPAQP